MGLTREYGTDIASNTKQINKIWTAYIRSDNLALVIKTQTYTMSQLIAATTGYVKVGYTMLFIILFHAIKVDFMSNILSKLFLTKLKKRASKEGIGFCSEREINDFASLKEQISHSNPEVKEKHITSIISHLLTNRKRFKITSNLWFMTILILIRYCMCCKKCKNKIYAN